MRTMQRMTRASVQSVHEAIRAAILNGEFSPAQHLVEAQLAERFNAGRHIIRLALERLDAEGLVTIEPNRGAVVTRLTLEEAADILLAREGLDGAAVRLATDRITDEQLRALKELTERMEEAIGATDYNRYSEYNHRFHAIIYDACGSRKIPELIASLKARVVRFQFRTILVPGRAPRSLAEHQRIYEALARRDPDEAERAAREHVAHMREALSQAWELVKL